VSDYKNITGGKELDAFLQSLPAKVESNIMRSALRAGANVFKEEIKAGVRVDQGDLKRSVRVTTRFRRGRVSASVKIGNKIAFYAHMVEFGTRPHKIKGVSIGGHYYTAVNHPGSKLYPFVRPALDSKADAAIQAVGEQIRNRLTLAGINTQAPEPVAGE